MAETLKNGRYEQRTEWKDASNGRVARFWDTNTHKEVFVKEFFKLRYPAQTTTPEGRVLAPLMRAKERVDRFCDKTRAINAKINEIAHAGGDVVVTTDFFREGLYIYKVSELIPLEDWAGVEVRDHLSMEQIDTLMQRLANALQTLQSAGVLHCDLKPENILLWESHYRTFTYNRRIPSSSSQVNRQACQQESFSTPSFALSTPDQPRSRTCTTLRSFLRATTVLRKLSLDSQWLYPCDIWSMGCILVEFYTGQTLFSNGSLKHLAMMENVVDKKIDQHLIQKVNKMSGRNSTGANKVLQAPKAWLSTAGDQPCIGEIYGGDEEA